jgi:hypothetical protein
MKLTSVFIVLTWLNDSKGIDRTFYRYISSLQRHLQGTEIFKIVNRLNSVSGKTKMMCNDNACQNIVFKNENPSRN